MTRPEILEKIDRFVGGHAPMSEECHAVYLMVEIRKVIDQARSLGRYPLLGFYADWTVHSEKDGVTDEIRHMLEQIGQVAFEETKDQHQDAPKRAPIKAFAHMAGLRREMQLFLTGHGIPPDLSANDEHWTAFVEQLLRVLESQPINRPAHNVKSVSFLRAQLRRVTLRVSFDMPVDGAMHFDHTDSY